ncbi:Uncharacterised protein [Mycobacteroides abscessus subsp. abscessus]|nr:Uncharacterised protein [Mycobacteroides abscessus subsp. abscessus]
MWALSSGRRSACTSSIPASAARAAAVRALSPVSIETRIPSACNRSMTSCASGRSSSRTAIAPITWPSSSISTAVAPACCIRSTSAARTPGSIQPGRPSRARRPSTRPVNPAPVTASTSVAGVTVSTAARMARARGCSLRDSSAAATASTRSPCTPPVAAISTTAGLFAVSVPVLSSATSRTRPIASSAAPPLTSTPSLLAAPIAATTVTGTEIASAHGEAATSTTSARSIQVTGSPKSAPITAMAVAAIMMPGTSGLAILSAKR